MNKIFVGAITAGLVSSTVILGDASAKADDVTPVPGTSAPSGTASKLNHFKSQWVPLIEQQYPGVADNPVLGPLFESANDQGQTSGPNLGQFANGVPHVGDIAPAISIPVESTNAGISAATTALSAANTARTVVSLVGGAQNALPSALLNALPSASPVKGGKSPLSTVRGLGPRGRK